MQQWLNQIIRTSAVLAVLAALAAGQQTAHTAGTILKQAEATNRWNYYQSKSIKRYLRLGQIDLMQALVLAQPALKPVLTSMEEQQRGESQRYEAELEQ